MTPFFLSLDGYFRYGTNWNFVLFLLFACSIAGVAVFIERLWQMKQAEMDTNRFMIQLRQWLEKGDVVRSIEECEKMNAAVTRMIHAGIIRHQRPKEHIETAMEIAGKLEIAHLEKNAKLLSLLAHIAPLIGLLGTVCGFIQAFAEMRMSGLVDISATRIGEAMEYALVTTAAGLVVAIPAILAYNYLVSRIEGFVLEMQTTSAEVVELLQTQKDPYR